LKQFMSILSGISVYISMNVKQFELLKEVLDSAKGIIETFDEGKNSELLHNQLIYLKNLVKEYEKHN